MNHYFKKKLRAFSLVELMVSLIILSIGIIGVVSVYAYLAKSTYREKGMESAVSFTDNYFSKIYLADKYKDLLLTAGEWSNLSFASQFPVIMPPITSNISDTAEVVINRKVLRLKPLLITVGINAGIGNENNTNRRRYHAETTFSELYMKRLSGL